jgi:hypothetical protein
MCNKIFESAYSILQVHLRRHDLGPFQAREIPEDERAVMSS